MLLQKEMVVTMARLKTYIIKFSDKERAELRK